MSAEQERELDNARAALLEAGRRTHTSESRVAAQRMVTALDSLRRERALLRAVLDVRLDNTSTLGEYQDKLSAAYRALEVHTGKRGRS